MKTNQKKELALAWQFSLAFLVAAALVMLPDYTFAGANTPVGNIFCTVASWFLGNTGKGLATIAVTIIGIGALLGKVSWGMALIVGLGIAVVFGAAGIVEAFGVPGMPSDCSTTGTWR